MNETYVECMVKHEAGHFLKFVKYLLIVLCVIAALFSFLFSGMLGVIGLIIAALLGVGSYYAGLNADIEYEYLYVDRQITVDKILAKAKRKKVATFDIEKMEILAPIKSYHLDDYKNRQAKEIDYSSGIEKQPDHRFAFYYEGQQKVLIEPSPEFVKAIYNVAPRKVFMD